MMPSYHFIAVVSSFIGVFTQREKLFEPFALATINNSLRSGGNKKKKGYKDKYMYCEWSGREAKENVGHNYGERGE